MTILTGIILTGIIVGLIQLIFFVLNYDEKEIVKAKVRDVSHNERERKIKLSQEVITYDANERFNGEVGYPDSDTI